MAHQNDAAEWPWREGRPEAVERVGPSRAPSVEADVHVPLWQAMASGAFGAGLGGLVLGLATWDAVMLALGAVAGYLVVAAGVWFVLLLEHRRMLWLMERAMLGLDEEGGTDELRVVVSQQDVEGRVVRMQYLNVAGVNADELREFARAVVDGAPLSVGYWTGRGSLFSRAEYEVLMAELVRAGLVRDGGTQGRQLTAAGRAILGRVASE